MSRNYSYIGNLKISSADLERWADTHETAMPVAIAIHAIADSNRTAQEIWEAPTPSEWDYVAMAVTEQVAYGNCEFDEDGYPWGMEIVSIENPLNA